MDFLQQLLTVRHTVNVRKMSKTDISFDVNKHVTNILLTFTYVSVSTAH